MPNTPERARKLLATAIATLAMLSGLQAPAHAHASVLSTFPLDGEQTLRGPDVVEIAFNETVTIPEGSVRLISGSGTQETLRPTLTEEISGTLLNARLPALATGWYAVSWRAISADGHPIGGTFTFRVGDTLQTLAESGLTLTDPARPYLAASHPLRAANYLATMLAIGLLGAAWASSGARTVAEAPMMAHRLRRGAMTAAVAGIASIALAVFNSALILNGGSYDRIGSVIQIILRSTAGSGYMIRLSGMLAMCTAVLLLAEKQTRKAGWVIAAAAAYGILHGYAIAGHAALVPREVLSRVSLVAHLAAGSAWLGGIPGVLLAVAARPRPSIAATAELVDRYSRIATASVSAVLVFGTATAYTMLSSISDLFTTAYGISMLAKILIVLILAGVGAYNHFSVVPSLRRRAELHDSLDQAVEATRAASGGANSIDEPDRLIRTTLSVESVGLLMVIVATAVLTSTGAPAAGWSDGIAHLGHRHGAGAGGLTPRLGEVLETLEPQILYAPVGSGEARISFAPGIVGRDNLIRIEVADGDGEPQEVLSATVTLSHPESGIEGLERTLEQRNPGDLRLRTSDLGVAGEWTAEAYLLLPGRRAEIFEFTLTTRGPL